MLGNSLGRKFYNIHMKNNKKEEENFSQIEEIRRKISVVDQKIERDYEEVRKGFSPWFIHLHSSVLHTCLHSKEYLDEWCFESISDLVMNDDYSIQVQSVVRDMKILRELLDNEGITHEDLELYLQETEDDR